MGFGFNLFLLFIVLPLTAVLIGSWLLTQKKIFGKALGLLWLAVAGLVFVSSILGHSNTPRELEEEDYYGWYVVDRGYFPGRQADWQYNSMRFYIASNGTINFYVTDKARIIKTFRGQVSTVKPYSSARLVLFMEQPTYHVVADNPTTYRSRSGFHLVFYSPEFNNVYFKKGEWEPLD